MPESKASAYLMLSSAMAIVGSSVVVGKVITMTIPVFVASALRFGLAAAILFVLVPREGRTRPDRKTLLVLALQALSGAVLFNAFLFYGLRFTGAAEAGIITSTTPALTALLSFLVLGERIGPRKWAALASCVAGILLLTLPGGAGGRGSSPLLGNLLVFGASAGEALFMVLLRMVPRSVKPLAISAWVNLFAFAMTLPLAAAELPGFDPLAAGAAGWVSVLYSAVFLAVIAYLLWFGGAQQVDAGTAALFMGVMPVSGVLLSCLLLGETFRPVHAAGIASVLAALRLGSARGRGDGG